MAVQAIQPPVLATGERLISILAGPCLRLTALANPRTRPRLVMGSTPEPARRAGWETPTREEQSRRVSAARDRRRSLARTVPPETGRRRHGQRTCAPGGRIDAGAGRPADGRDLLLDVQRHPTAVRHARRYIENDPGILQGDGVDNRSIRVGHALRCLRHDRHLIADLQLRGPIVSNHQRGRGDNANIGNAGHGVESDINTGRGERRFGASFQRRVMPRKKNEIRGLKAGAARCRTVTGMSAA